MNIVITGAKGFIGKNLSIRLKEISVGNIIEINRRTSKTKQKQAIRHADFIFHFAGANRPKDEKDFHIDNVDYTDLILSYLKENKKKPPILFSSTIQADKNNNYGTSKTIAENKIIEFGKKFKSKYYIFRLQNIFGKWAKPNYNSVVATFCSNIANSKRINIHDPEVVLELVYIDDLCDEFIRILQKKPSSGYKKIKKFYKRKLGKIAEKISSFKNSRSNLITEKVGRGFDRALYSTYLSYLPPRKFNYKLDKNIDERGIFCEMLKTKDSGQISFFTAHPGITRGAHYHHTKTEKFLVLKGKAQFRFKNIINGIKYEIMVSDKDFEIVETIPGWYHDVKNIGDEELIVMLWANEIFNAETPDTVDKFGFNHEN